MKNAPPFFDLHVHSCPDVFERKYTPEILGEELLKNASSAVIKSHLVNTVSIASMARRMGYPIFGSITLNGYVGGLKYPVVQSAIASMNEKDPIIIYFPTITNIKHESTYKRGALHPVLEKHPLEGLSISINGKIKEEVKDIIKLAVYYNIPLATGHCSKEEAYLLIDEVEKQRGRLIITHPFVFYTKFTVNEIIQILNSTNFVYIELTLLMLKLNRATLSDIKDILDNVQISKVCVSSDFGQLDNSTVSCGFANFFEQLNAVLYNNPIEAERIYKELCYKNPMSFIYNS